MLAGRGPDEARLRARAAESKVPVRFVISPSDELLRSLMQHARLYVFPAVEDFGIMPVEAIALGTPSLVNAVGGAQESVTMTSGGMTAAPEDRQGWREAATAAMDLDMAQAMSASRAFSIRAFDAKIRAWIGGHLAE